MRRGSVWMVVAIALGVACGSTPSTDPLTDSEAAQQCRRMCEYAVLCDPGSDLDGCISRCVGFIAGVYRRDAMRAFVDCRVSVPCDVTDSACLVVVEPTEVHREYEERCRAALVDCVPSTELDLVCEVEPNGDEGIGAWSMVAPSIIEEFVVCFSESDCMSRLACLDAAFASHGLTRPGGEPDAAPHPDFRRYLVGETLCT